MTDFQNEGLIQYNSHNFEQALENLNKAIEIDPASPLSWTLRGDIKRILGGDLDDAENDCLHALQLDPKYLNSFRALYIIYLQKKDWVNALKSLVHINLNSKTLPKVQVTTSSEVHTSEEKRLFAEEVYRHIIENILPIINGREEKIVNYWLTEISWNKFLGDALVGGTKYLTGSAIVGYGYILLTDRNVFFVNLGHMADRLVKRSALANIIGTVLFLGVFNDSYHEKPQKKTMIKEIPYKDLHFADDNLRYPRIEEKVWEIDPYHSIEEMNLLYKGINLGLLGNTGQLFEPFPLPKHKEPNEVSEMSVNLQETVFDSIEKLKKLLDTGLITLDMYERKVNELMDRI